MEHRRFSAPHSLPYFPSSFISSPALSILFFSLPFVYQIQLGQMEGCGELPVSPGGAEPERRTVSDAF